MPRSEPQNGRRTKAFALAAAASMLLSNAGTTHAQSAVEQFYRGKTIDLVSGFPLGGGNDVIVRMVARHLPKHLPGAPNVVTRNMPGAGSLTAANHLYSAAARPWFTAPSSVWRDWL